MSETSTPAPAASSPDTSSAPNPISEGLIDTVAARGRKAEANGTPPPQKGAPSNTENPWGLPEELLNRKFKYKADGSEEEVDLQTLFKERELSSAARKRMFDAFKLKEQVDRREAELQGFVKTLQEEPEKALRQLKSANPKLREAMERLLLEDIQAEQMDPRERAIRDRESAIAQREEEIQRHAQEQELRQLEAMKEQQRPLIEQVMVNAAEQAGLAPTPATFKLMAQQLSLAAKAGYHNPPMELVAAQVMDEQRSVLSSFLKSQPPQAVIKLLGEDLLKHIRQMDLARAQPQTQPPVVRSAPSQPRERVKLDERSFDEEVRRRLQQT